MSPSSKVSTSFRQLPLHFGVRDVLSFDTLVAGSNAVAVGIVQQCALGEGEKQVYIWSPHGEGKGGGKSHLLQAACHQAAQNQRTVCYLPVREIINLSVDVLDELEQLDLVCLDDIELMAQLPDWEEALFDLINRMRESGNSLLLAASSSPEAIAVKLPDLRSRLAWGPVFQLQALSDDGKREALRTRAGQRGLEMPDNVAEYLMRHYPRDLFGLFERLELLDTAAMAMQRRLTVPFVKSVLESAADI
ncbi:MAG: DnaA regulatory inactivator Hda [Gammaproteobacteria bacterium]|nr:DnaA regulatory inactivator Hda [Gammaproteobacteria bacterium]